MFVVDMNYKDASEKKYPDKSAVNLTSTRHLQAAYETWIGKVKELIQRQEAKAPDLRFNVDRADMADFQKWKDDFYVAAKRYGADVDWDKYSGYCLWRPAYMIQLTHDNPRWDST